MDEESDPSIDGAESIAPWTIAFNRSLCQSKNKKFNLF